MAIPHVNPTEPGYVHEVLNRGQSHSQEIKTETRTKTSKLIPNETVTGVNAVSYTHLTLPTKRIV